MSSSVANDVRRDPRVLLEKANHMAGGALRNADSDEFSKEIGRCLDYARRVVGWTLDELAGHLPPPPEKDKRDPRQVQRWMDGKEHTQLAAVFAVEPLREPFVIALARLARMAVEETVTIRRAG